MIAAAGIGRGIFDNLHRQKAQPYIFRRHPRRGPILGIAQPLEDQVRVHRVAKCHLRNRNAGRSRLAGWLDHLPRYAALQITPSPKFPHSSGPAPARPKASSTSCRGSRDLHATRPSKMPVSTWKGAPRSSSTGSTEVMRQLQAEHDHLTSYATEKEIMVNESTFTEAGRRFG